MLQQLLVVLTSGVNAVLVGNDFPELGTDLVAALAPLDVTEFTHGECVAPKKMS